MSSIQRQLVILWTGAFAYPTKLYLIQVRTAILFAFPGDRLGRQLSAATAVELTGIVAKD